MRNVAVGRIGQSFAFGAAVTGFPGALFWGVVYNRGTGGKKHAVTGGFRQ